jgi:N-acetylglucosaminyldiphosphoundecaprenol N-acetyl-beta-D-mannosaminyltransferase
LFGIRFMQLLQQSSVLGLPIDLMANYDDWLTDRLRLGLGTHVVTLNAEMAIAAEKDARLAGVIRQADLVIPDGAGVVFYLRLRGIKVKRCPGIELAQEAVVAAATDVFLFGGKPGIAQLAADRWEGIQFSGVYDGFGDDSIVLRELERLQPALILVGLGVPKQEFWIQQNRQVCPNSVWIGVGGSFDIWSGSKTRAPKWLADNNLEWAFRLWQEPWRVGRMAALPLFLGKALYWREKR